LVAPANGLSLLEVTLKQIPFQSSQLTANEAPTEQQSYVS